MTRTSMTPRPVLLAALASCLLLVGSGPTRIDATFPATGQERQAAANPLGFLEPFMGPWVPDASDSVYAARPELRDMVVHHYAWTVGGQAVELREGYPRARPEESQFHGFLFWDPATERVEFVGVAGFGDDEGRLFRGEYTALDDGRIERIYDVYYRTLSDIPGEELGGLRRRYREVYTIEGDRIEATLDWWRDGRWQPFGPGTYAAKRPN